MARILPILIPRNNVLVHLLPAPVTFLIALTAILSVLSVVTLLCGSHRKEQRTVRLGGEKKRAIQKLHSGLSSKALLMAKMISWRKVQDDHGVQEEDLVYHDDHWDFEEDDESDVVWKKNIIRGEKCRPLDFSGKILYDSNGNLLTD